MAELTIRPEEIRDALAHFVQEYEPEGASREEVGTVIECGDGIARVEGLPSAMANELLEFENGVRGLALNLDVREIGVVILGEFNEIEEGQQVKRTGEVLSVPVGDSFLGRVVGPLGEPLDGKGPIEDTELRLLETQAPSVVERQPVKEPLQTGIKAIDAMTAIGRGQRQLIIGDRQTGKTRDRHRRDHQPEGQLGVRRSGPPGALRLRRDRPEGLHDRPGARGPRGGGRARVHHDRRRPGLGPVGLQVHRALHRFGHRAALDVPGQARADRLRRPVQAGRGVPRGVAAAAPAAGPRGVPGRRVLPAFPAARAVRQAVRRAGRRVADRAADRRDQGQRHLGLHPDQRHLDHRRADLPGDRPVQRRRAAGHQRGPLGVASRR